jgi:hypothetical protein
LDFTGLTPSHLRGALFESVPPPIVLVESAYLPIDPRPFFGRNVHLVRVSPSVLRVFQNSIHRGLAVARVWQSGVSAVSMLSSNSLETALMLAPTCESHGWLSSPLVPAFVLTFSLVMAVKHLICEATFAMQDIRGIHAGRPAVVHYRNFGSVHYQPGINFLIAPPASGKSSYSRTLPTNLFRVFSMDDYMAAAGEGAYTLSGSTGQDFDYEMQRRFAVSLRKIREALERPTPVGGNVSEPSDLVDFSKIGVPVEDALPKALLDRAIIHASAHQTPLVKATVTSMIANIITDTMGGDRLNRNPVALVTACKLVVNNGIDKARTYEERARAFADEFA